MFAELRAVWTFAPPVSTPVRFTISETWTLTPAPAVLVKPHKRTHVHVGDAHIGRAGLVSDQEVVVACAVSADVQPGRRQPIRQIIGAGEGLTHQKHVGGAAR